MEKKQILVLGAKRWKFTDEDTGKVLEGITVHLVDLDQENDSDGVGFIPTKINYRNYSDFETFKNGPGIYEASISLDLTSRQPRIQWNGFKFVKPFQMKVV